MTSHINQTYEEWREYQAKAPENEVKALAQWNAYSKEVQESFVKMYCVIRQLNNISWNTKCRIKYGDEFCDYEYMEWHSEDYGQIRMEFDEDYCEEGKIAVEIINMLNEENSGVNLSE